MGSVTKPADPPSGMARTPDVDGLDLLVASGGGHLQELVLAYERLEPRLSRAHWVTYPTPEAFARLAGCRVTPCHHPTSRHAGNAVRNLVLADRMLRRLRPDRVISTGAGVAVPFLAAARARGIPAYYVESAARTEGPSLSGRLLQPLLRDGLYTQHARWSDGTWAYVGNLFDGFTPTQRAEPGRRPLRVVVSVGTQTHPFDRLLRALAAVTDTRDEVRAQTGTSSIAPAHWHHEDFVSPDRLAAWFAWADVVVCHAGVGLTLNAVTGGRAPLLVARSRAAGESVDDHQQQLADELGRRGIARSVAPHTLTRAVLTAQARAGVEHTPAARWLLPIH